MPDQPAYDPQTLQERDPAREIAWTCWNSGDPFLAGSHEGADKIRGLLQEIKELRARLEADVEIGRQTGEIAALTEAKTAFAKALMWQPISTYPKLTQAGRKILLYGPKEGKRLLRILTQEQTYQFADEEGTFYSASLFTHWAFVPDSPADDFAPECVAILHEHDAAKDAEIAALKAQQEVDVKAEAALGDLAMAMESERDRLKARLDALPGKIDKVLDRWLGRTRPKEISSSIRSLVADAEGKP